MEYYQSIAGLLKSESKRPPGSYASGGVCSMPLPSLVINSAPDVIIGLPLADSQAKSIIDLSTQAPYGKGEETVVDTSVRRTWQLSPTHFSIKNKQWSSDLEILLKRVKEELGCSAMKVSCELYKLLLYECGGFFKVS